MTISRPSTKHELRKIYREKRLNLALEEFQSLNEQLLTQVRTLVIQTRATIHLFLPIEGNREPNTYAIADWLRSNDPQVRLVLSQTDITKHGMRHVVWDTDTRLVLNNWKIPEPATGATVLPKEIDVVFVPLLAFDRQGHRVGYGKGFYDRFLAECRPDAVKIGLSLFEPEPWIADTDEHDKQLDHCVTPHRTWHFNTIP